MAGRAMVVRAGCVHGEEWRGRRKYRGTMITLQLLRLKLITTHVFRRLATITSLLGWRQKLFIVIECHVRSAVDYGCEESAPRASNASVGWCADFISPPLQGLISKSEAQVWVNSDAQETEFRIFDNNCQSLIGRPLLTRTMNGFHFVNLREGNRNS